MFIITASNATSLLEILYVLLIDHLESGEGKPKEETALEIQSLAPKAVQQWAPALPGLRDTLVAVLKGRKKSEMLARLGAEIKAIVPHAKKDEGVSGEDLELLASLGAYFRTNSEVALKKLKRMASATKSPWVVQHLAPKATDQGESRSALTDLVQSLVGRKASALTMEEAKQIKDLKPEQYKEYLRLRKDYNQSWKDALVSYIRSSGGTEVDYSKALEYLKLNGIDHLLPEGFDGLMDDRGRMYTKKGVAIDGVPNAVTFPKVTMNPSYGKADGGDWVFRADRANGEPGPYFYTSDFKKKKAKEKFTKVASLAPKIAGMQKKWFTHVRKFNPSDPTCVAAVVLEILYEFSARIGSVGNSAGGSSTYGVATLLVKHAIIDPSGNITLRYKGKDGVSTVHKLSHTDPQQKCVIEALHELLAGKEPRDRIFTVRGPGGKQRPLTAGQVNAYWKSLGAGDTTVHKIRTCAGTTLFQSIIDPYLEKYKDNPPTEAKIMAFFKAAAESVGKKLNHVRRGATGTKVTGTTALAAYIDPTIQIQFFRELGLRPPKFLEKFDLT